MEKIPEPIENPDHAWDMAHAEKPLRDIAREDWVNEDQKKALDSMAISRGEAALEGMPEEKAAEPENQAESQEVTIKKIIEVIKHSPDIQFVAAGLGNVLNKPGGYTAGRDSYYFDSNTQKMQYGNMDFLDRNPKGINADIPFKRQYHGFFDGNKGYIIMRLPFLAGYGEKNNPYLTDLRGGAYLTLGVRYDREKISSKDEDIVTILKNPNSLKDPDGFFDELFGQCAEEFIPDYYHYVLGIVKQYEIQNKK